MPRSVLDQVSVHDAQGIVTDLMQKLGGGNGKEWLTATKKFLRSKNGWQFPVWKTITLGYGNRLNITSTSVVEYKKQLDTFGHRVEQNAGNGFLLDSQNFRCSPVEVKVDLVIVKAGDLGLPANARYDHVVDAALSYGLEVCPVEVGPALRIEFKQRIGGMVVVVVDRSITINGVSVAFVLGRKNAQRSTLTTVQCWRLGGEPLVEADYDFIFVRPRP